MRSIYQQAMGGDFGRLQPELREYFGLAAGGGLAGHGRGVFDVAGCPAWFARPAFRLTARENAFFPEYNSDVPFEIRNYPHLDPFGRAALTARRTLDFGTTQRVFEDTTSLQDGILTDYVGMHRRMATLLTCSATADGHIRMVSSQTRVFAGLRLSVPDALGALAYVEQWWDDDAGAFRISTRVVHRQLGTLLVYAGRFVYTMEEFDGVLPVEARPRRWEQRV